MKDNQEDKNAIYAQMAVLLRDLLVSGSSLRQENYHQLKSLVTQYPEILIELAFNGSFKEKKAALRSLIPLINLKKIVCPEKQAFFLEALQEETESELRPAYLWVLLVMLEIDPDPTILSALIPYFLDEASDIRILMTRHSQLFTLGTEFLALLIDDEVEEVRKSARVSLLKICSPQTLAILEKHGMPLTFIR